MNPININNIPYSVKEYFGGYDNIKTVIDLINASLVQIDPSGTVGSTTVYIDGSLSARDVSIAALNTSKALLTYVNSSIGSRDTSIAWLVSALSARDVSIAFLDASKAYKAYTDGSLNAKANITYVDSSIGARDVSIAWLNTFKATTLTQLPTEDASGVNGQMYFASNKAYLKIGGKWIRFDASTIY
jgi:hypothetical protein